MREPWLTRWYTPLLALGGVMLLVLVLAVTFVEVLTADMPSQETPRVWATSLHEVDTALARGNRDAALNAWRQANGVALRSAEWDAMVTIGDAARRIGDDSRAQARQAYLTALFSARRERSVEGLLRVAAAFGELGDREVLVHALHLAEQEAGRDPLKRARVRRVATRWMSPPLEAESRDPTLSGGQHP